MFRDPKFLLNHHVVAGLYPDPDVDFPSPVTTPAIHMHCYEVCTFFFLTGGSFGNGSTDIVTIEACDDAAGTNAVAMPFMYWYCPSSTTVDAWTGPTSILAAGVELVGLDNYIYAFEVSAPEILAAGLYDATNGWHHADWARLVITINAQKDPYCGCVYAVLSNPRFADSTMPSAIV